MSGLLCGGNTACPWHYDCLLGDQCPASRATTAASLPLFHVALCRATPLAGYKDVWNKHMGTKYKANAFGIAGEAACAVATDAAAAWHHPSFPQPCAFALSHPLPCATSFPT